MCNDEQDVTERYFFFSEGSNVTGKIKFVSQFTCLQPCLEHFYLLKMQSTVWETRTMCFKKESDFLLNQPRTCCIFILCCIKSIVLH